MIITKRKRKKGLKVLTAEWEEVASSTNPIPSASSASAKRSHQNSIPLRVHALVLLGDGQYSAKKDQKGIKSPTSFLPQKKIRNAANHARMEQRSKQSA